MGESDSTNITVLAASVYCTRVTCNSLTPTTFPHFFATLCCKGATPHEAKRGLSAAETRYFRVPEHGLVDPLLGHQLTVTTGERHRVTANVSKMSADCDK